MTLEEVQAQAGNWRPSSWHDLVAGVVSGLGFAGIVAAMLLGIEVPHDMSLLEAGALAWTFGRASS